MSGAITLTREGKSRSVGSLKIKAKSKKKKNYGVVESDSLNGADKVLTISDVHVGDRGYLILFVHSTCVQLRTGLPLISRGVVLLMPMMLPIKLWELEKFVSRCMTTLSDL